MLSFLAQIPLEAERMPAMDSMGWFGNAITNSILVALIVAGIILWLARTATRKMELVPTHAGGQNVFEMVVEALYDMVEGVVGKHMVAKAFPLLATLFIFILTSNWFGLLPGVGTVGFGEHRGALLSLQHVEAPLLRPANADLNLTLAMALVFTFFWFVWSFQELGVGGFFGHIFAPKGGLKGFLWWALLPIFGFVGLIEIVSIAFRPVSLSLRLFGNIYAGENLMHTMSSLGDGLPQPFPIILAILIPIPFYFLELLVGVVQALVFTLLCSVYLQLTTSHEGGDHAAHDDAHHDDHGHTAPVPAGAAAATPAAAH